MVEQKRPLLKLKPKATPPAATTPVVTSVVVTRRRRYEVVNPNKKPVEAETKPAKPAIKPPAKKPVAKPAPKPVKLPAVEIPRFVKVAVVLTILRQQWPHLFDENDPKLWAVGIRKKMDRALKPLRPHEGIKKISSSLVGDALDLWKSLHPNYRAKTLILGTPRYGLSGEIEGHVTDAHLAIAQSMMNQSEEKSDGRSGVQAAGLV